MSEVLERLVLAAAGIEPRSGVRTCLIGGLARNLYAEPRATRDVDVIVDTPNATEILVHAPAIGLVAVEAEVEVMARSQMTRLRLPDELTGKTKLDIIACSHEYYSRVLDRSRVVEVLGTRIRAACAEDIVLLKVLAGRPQDRLDVDAIVQAQGELLDRALIRREAAALEIELPESLR